MCFFFEAGGVLKGDRLLRLAAGCGASTTDFKEATSEIQNLTSLRKLSFRGAGCDSCQAPAFPFLLKYYGSFQSDAHLYFVLEAALGLLPGAIRGAAPTQLLANPEIAVETT